MKNHAKSIRYVFGLAVLLLLAVLYGCKKDTVEPEPEPVNEPTTVGVRLQVDSIVCVNDKDDCSFDGFYYDPIDNIEIYGFIRAFAAYGYPLVSPPSHYEKKDTALLWYRDADQAVTMNNISHSNGFPILLNPPNSNGEYSLERGYVDFFCDIKKTNQCRIYIVPFFMDKETLEPGHILGDSWEPFTFSGYINGRYYTIPLNNLYVVRPDLLDNHISFTMEELLTQGERRRVRMIQPETKSEVEVWFSVHRLNEESEVRYPEGKGPGIEFKEPDHIIPAPPRGVTALSPPPTISDKLVVAQVPSKVFGPQPMSAVIEGVKYSVYNYRPNFLSQGDPIVPLFESKNLDYGPYGSEKWVGLVRNDALFDITARKPFREPYGYKMGDHRLQSRPYLQMVRYWRLLDSNQIPKGKQETISKETTVGISHTEGYELAITASIGGSGIFDIFSFNLEIKNTFNTSYTYSYEEKVKTEGSFGPYDYEVRCNIWQEVHEFRVVDDKGRLFTDPNYEFRSMVIATIPINNFYQDIQEFK